MRQGGVILYPTDTIWGIGCDATNEEAVRRVYEIKQRDDSKALICLVDSDARLQRYVRNVPDVAWQLIDCVEKPTTLILDGAVNLAPNLIADDGSTDNTCEIISRYKDPRIRLLRREHDFIATLNALLYEAKGKYIARMDDDDVMLPDRLRLEYEYMEAHPEVAAVGGALEIYSTGDKAGNVPVVTAHDLLEGCGIYNPTSMVRREVLHKYGFRYEQAYIYAEDFRFWAEYVKHDLIIHNIEDVLIRYRTSATQISSKYSAQQLELTRNVQYDLMQWIKEREEEVKNDYEVVPVSGNKLSVCMSFLNEGEEVGNTVRSIRETAGDTVDIIAINDASTDGYDYEADLKELNVHYFVNKRRIGSAAGKEKAVQISSTPYFLLIDAHMRFYQKDWVSRIVEELDKNPHQLLCCQNKALIKETDGTVKDKGEMGAYGAYLRFDNDFYIPQIKWNGNQQVCCLEPGQIPAVLGACYCASKEYWNRLRGYQGLIHYGNEEAYISIKAWMEGGGCRLLNEISLGHIYREKAPYKMVNLNTTFNYLVITETLFPPCERARARAIAKRLNPSVYNQMLTMLEVYGKELDGLRRYYQQAFTAHDLVYIHQINDLPTQENRTIVNEEQARLPQIITEINEEISHNIDISLSKGTSGAMLTLACYAETFSDEKIDDTASGLLSDILEHLSESDLPHGFNNGYSGIGWTLIYLICHNILDDTLNEELQYIDARIMEINFSKVKDLSFETGIGGMLAYINARMGMMEASCEHRKENSFTSQFLDDVSGVCENVIVQQDIDMRTLIQAMIFAECYKQNDWKTLPPRIEEFIALPMFLPKEEEYQKPGLAGKAGFALFLTGQIKKINNSKPFVITDKV